MLAGRRVRGLDQTGLSQKAGPVVSDICITTSEAPASNHANSSGVDCIVAFDLLVAASDSNLVGAHRDTTVLVSASEAVPTGEMVTHPDRSLPTTATLLERLGQVTRRDHNVILDSAALARGLVGSTATANILVLGAAVQAGAVPLPVAAVERAIELNGVAVDANIAAFRWGRAWFDDPSAVERSAGIESTPRPETTDELIDRLVVDLTSYQSPAYADRFRRIVDDVRGAETRVVPGSSVLTETVARNLHKLMAYKDEYEVARLMLTDDARRQYIAIGGARTKVTYHLHPPILEKFGLDRKIGLTRSAPWVFRALRAGKRLRGTLADPFGWAHVRRLERAMIPEYISAVRVLLDHLDATTLLDAAEIASLPDQVRGYEDLKVARATAYRLDLARRLDELTGSREAR